MMFIIYVLTGLAIGVLVDRFIIQRSLKNQESDAQNKAKKILQEAEQNAEILKKDKLLQAKEKACFFGAIFTILKNTTSTYIWIHWKRGKK